ncbi:MAG: thioredoxin-disulfide reductase [Bacteroidota bacterium]
MSKTFKNSEKVTLLILGAGPAGYTAAIYAARSGLETVLYQGPQPGGLLTTTTDVDNYPGYPQGIEGMAMMDNLQKQAERFGSKIRQGTATQVVFHPEKKYQVIIDNQHLIIPQLLIIATGASSKWLGIPSEQRLLGRGVSTCAVCDGNFFKNQDVAVVGGGNTAVEEAMYLSKICNKVYLLVRRDQLRATHILQKNLMKLPNVEILWHTEAQEIIGKDMVEGIHVINNQTKVKSTIAVQGFFIAIGHIPNTAIFPSHLPAAIPSEKIVFKDAIGYIQTVPGTSKTNLPGIFAAGDVQDKNYRQAITAAASGCMAALDAERYLQTKN